jgi:hypothetical protein
VTSPARGTCLLARGCKKLRDAPRRSAGCVFDAGRFFRCHFMWAATASDAVSKRTPPGSRGRQGSNSSSPPVGLRSRRAWHDDDIIVEGRPIVRKGAVQTRQTRVLPTAPLPTGAVILPTMSEGIPRPPARSSRQTADSPLFSENRKAASENSDETQVSLETHERESGWITALFVAPSESPACCC